MNDQRSSENWELEEGGEDDDRWVLEESEQRLTDQWQLEDDQVEDVGEWQPVEYQRQRRAGSTWILPSIITVALLGVIGYSAWTLVPRIFGETTSTPPADETALVPQGETPTAEIGEVEATTASEGEPEVVPSTGTVTEEPSPPPPPTATSPPTPPVVNQDFATVTSTYGVNARIAPTVDAEIIRILEQGETFFVLEQRDEGWLEIFVIEPGTELRPDQPVEGRVGYAAEEYFAIASQPLLEEFANEILTAAGRPPTPEPEPTVPSPPEAGGTTGADRLPTVTPISEGQAVSPTPQPSVTVASSVSVTIDVPYGLNVRVQPSLASDIVALLENGTTVPAISRYVDDQWVMVALGDGAQGWLFVEFAVIEGDLNSLPVTSTGELPTATPIPTPTPEVTAETAPVEPPAPFTSTLPADSPAIIVPSINGVNARSDPRSDAEVVEILPQNAALPARARSADEQWVQVELPDGTLVWVFRGAVVATSDVTTLPIVGETGASTEPAPTAESTPTPVGDTPVGDDAAEAVAVVTVRSIVLAVYPEPDLTLDSIEVMARGNDLPALARTAAGDWIQVQTKSGATGWVNASAVALNVDIETLPVVQ